MDYTDPYQAAVFVLNTPIISFCYQGAQENPFGALGCYHSILAFNPRDSFSKPGALK
jgi:hypothetical protein